MTESSTKPFVVVTGASSGIGYELLRQFAAHGYDLLVIAEDEGSAARPVDLPRKMASRSRVCAPIWPLGKAMRRSMNAFDPWVGPSMPSP